MSNTTLFRHSQHSCGLIDWRNGGKLPRIRAEIYLEYGERSSQNSLAALYFETSLFYSENGITSSLRNFGKFLSDITTLYLRGL